MLSLLLLAQLGSPQQSWARAECPAGGDTTRERCGWVEVAEDRSQPGGRTIRLFVMRKQPPTSPRRPGSAPIVFLDGGPGRAAHVDAWWAELVLGTLVDTHSLLFLDQRGTGNSAPLECNLWPERRASDGRYPVVALRRCREELSAKAALGHYATKDAVMDLEAVRRAVGAEQLNLYGVSYGARVAAAYAVLFPERVRSMVLHSADTFGRWPEVTREASRRVFERAIDRHSTGKRRMLTTLSAPDEVLRSLENAALRVRFGIGSRIDSMQVGPRTGAWLIRDLLYDPVNWKDLQPLLRALQDRRATPILVEALEGFARNENNQSVGAFFGVTCIEDVGLASTVIAWDWAAVPQQELAEVCREWPKAPLPRWWGRAPPSSTPTLLISGSWDPVTPADSAAALAGRMGQAHLLVVERGGHGGTWQCAIRAVERFVLAGNTAGLPATCR